MRGAGAEHMVHKHPEVSPAIQVGSEDLRGGDVLGSLGSLGSAEMHSHGVVENDILLGQLQQHGIVEELADAHILAQAL